MIILRIILNVVVAYSPAECADWMRDYLPIPALHSEHVRLDKPTEGPGCIIRYQSTIHIEGFKGV